MLGQRVPTGLLKDRAHGGGDLLVPRFAAQHRLGGLLFRRGLGRRGAVGRDDAAAAPIGLGGGGGGGLDLGARRGRGAHPAHGAVVELVVVLIAVVATLLGVVPVIKWRRTPTRGDLAGGAAGDLDLTRAAHDAAATIGGGGGGRRRGDGRRRVEGRGGRARRRRRAHGEAAAEAHAHGQIPAALDDRGAANDDLHLVGISTNPLGLVGGRRGGALDGHRFGPTGRARIKRSDAAPEPRTLDVLDGHVEVVGEGGVGQGAQALLGLTDLLRLLIEG